MTVSLEITPDVARIMQDVTANREVSLEQMRQSLTMLALQVEKTLHPPQVRRPRVAGLGRGDVFKISDDFDNPLPDEFWLGDAANDPLYQTGQKS